MIQIHFCFLTARATKFYLIASKLIHCCISKTMLNFPKMSNNNVSSLRSNEAASDQKLQQHHWSWGYVCLGDGGGGFSGG